MVKTFSDIEASYGNGKLCSTALIHGLIEEDWGLTGVNADQWMGLHIQSEDSDDFMVIECDFIEYGLLAAYLIAKSLNNNKVI